MGIRDCTSVSSPCPACATCISERRLLLSMQKLWKRKCNLSSAGFTASYSRNGLAHVMQSTYGAFQNEISLHTPAPNDGCENRYKWCCIMSTILSSKMASACARSLTASRVGVAFRAPCSRSLSAVAPAGSTATESAYAGATRPAANPWTKFVQSMFLLTRTSVNDSDSIR